MVSRKNDSEVALARQHGMAIQWLMTYTPKWDAKPDIRNNGLSTCHQQIDLLRAIPILYEVAILGS